MPDLVERIASDLTVARSLIDDALRLAHSRYRKIRVPKRSGGYRVMLQPATELKVVHGWLLANVLAKLPVSDIASAFRAGSSIVANAIAHRSSAYAVRVDLSAFFPSIAAVDLLDALATASDDLSSWTTDSSFRDVVTRACFDRYGRLPIGYSTSPCIANAVMYRFDRLMLQVIAADTDRFGNAILTRYADDFVFSTNKRGACGQFVVAMRDAVASTASPKLSINESKTRYMSRQRGSTLVTGLRINTDGRVGVHPDYRDHVRLLLKLYAANTLKAEEHQVLRGHLAFVEHADPSLFTRLSFKHFAQIATLRA